MKTQIATAVLTVVMLSPLAWGQSMSQKKITSQTPVTLNCVRSASGGAKNITWQTSYGSEAREIARTLTYDCAVRWSGRSVTNAALDVWFVGIPAAGGKDMILDNKTYDLILNPLSNCVTRVTSETIDHSKADYVALGIKDRDGAKLRGCVVQLIMGEQVIRAYTSLGHLKDAAWKYPFGSLSDGTIGDP